MKTMLGRVLGGLAVAFLTFDAVAKVLELPMVIDGTMQLGYSPDVVVGLGITLLCCVLAYLVPQTSVIGAVLLTGYLGGAVATHVRIGSPLLTHILFPVYVALIVWGGLYFREPRLPDLIPLRG